MWLPFAFAAFGLLLSRSYVRSSTHNFKRVDWLMYAARTFEFSRTMHGVAFAAVLVYFAAILVGYDARGGSGLVILQLLLVALLALLSHFGRKALVRKNAVKARGHAVSIGAALTLLGFLGVIVFSVVTGAAAGLTNGGLGLVAAQPARQPSFPMCPKPGVGRTVSPRAFPPRRFRRPPLIPTPPRSRNPYPQKKGRHATVENSWKWAHR